MRLGSDVTNVRRNDLSECFMLYRSKVSLGRRLPMVPPRSRRMSGPGRGALSKKIYEIVNLRVVCTGSVGAADPIDPAD